MAESPASKEALAKRVPAALRPLVQSLYRRYRTAVEYHRYQRLLAPNRELRARHPDPRRCFIIANGPSIKQQDLTLLRDETTINPFHVVIVGLLAGLLFVLALVGLVTVITRNAG